VLQSSSASAAPPAVVRQQAVSVSLIYIERAFVLALPVASS
jgi:hypothetical protein